MPKEKNPLPRADDSPSLPQSRPPAKRTQPTRGHVSQACERCRRLRARCDGQLPCNTCDRASAQCEYTSRDRRGKADRPSVDIIDDLKVRKRVLDHLWQAIQRGDDDSMLASIRAGISLPEFVRNVFGEEMAASLQTDPPQSPATTDEAMSSQPHGLTHLDWSLEDPFAQSQASQHVLTEESYRSRQGKQESSSFPPTQHPYPMLHADQNMSLESSQRVLVFGPGPINQSSLFTTNPDEDERQYVEGSQTMQPPPGWNQSNPDWTLD